MPVISPAENQIKSVPIVLIDAETSPFRLDGRRSARFPALKDSIERYGVTEPVWLQSADGGAGRLVHGFQRYRAAVELGLTHLPARIFRQVPSDELLQKTVSQNRAVRNLSLFEKSLAITAFISFGTTQEQLVNTFLPLLGFPSLAKTARTLTTAAHLNKRLLCFLSDKDIPLRRLASFLDLDPTSQSFFAELADECRPSLNELELLARLSAETARRDDTDPWNSLKKAGAENLSKKPRACFLGNLLKNMRAARYPEMAERQAQLESLVERLKIPDGAQLTWDASLEKSGVTLQAHVRHVKDLDSLSSWFAKEERRLGIRRLLEELE